MADSKLVQGLLVASGICLAFAIFMTWADISRYKESGAAVAAPARPTGLDRFAPEGTWAVALISPRKRRQAEILQDLLKGAPTPSGPMQKATEMAMFALPMKTISPGTKPDGCGLIQFDGTSKMSLAKALADAGGTKATVGGNDVYTMPQHGKFLAGALATVADDTTVLFGSTQEALNVISAAYQSGQGARLSDALKKMTLPYQGHAINAGFVLPAGMLDAIKQSGAKLPPFMAGLQGGAVGIDLSSQVSLGARLRLGSDQDAQQAQAAATAQIEKAKQAAGAPGPMAMLVPLVQKVQVQAEGDTVSASLTLAKEDFQPIAEMFKGMFGTMVKPGAGAPGM